MGHGRKLSHYYILILHYWCIYFWKKAQEDFYLFVSVWFSNAQLQGRALPHYFPHTCLLGVELTWKKGWGCSASLASFRSSAGKFLELKSLEKNWNKGEINSSALWVSSEISYSALWIYILVVSFPAAEVISAVKHHEHKQNRVPFKKSPCEVIRLETPCCSCESWQIANNWAKNTCDADSSLRGVSWDDGL